MQISEFKKLTDQPASWRSLNCENAVIVIHDADDEHEYRAFCDDGDSVAPLTASTMPDLIRELESRYVWSFGI